jgi:hypothetical protein
MRFDRYVSYTGSTRKRSCSQVCPLHTEEFHGIADSFIQRYNLNQLQLTDCPVSFFFPYPHLHLNVDSISFTNHIPITVPNPNQLVSSTSISPGKTPTHRAHLIPPNTNRARARPRGAEGRLAQPWRAARAARHAIPVRRACHRRDRVRGEDYGSEEGEEVRELHFGG